MTQVHTNIHTSRPLVTHFETQTLTQLSLNPNLFCFHLSYQPTDVAKTGLGAFIAKLPVVGDDSPISMDIDIGCGLYNHKDELMETVWYGNVRNGNESIRLAFDDFGDSIHRPSLLTERLTIAINALDSTVYKLVIFINCVQKIALKEATFGSINFECDHDTLHTLQFASLEDNVSAIAAWQLGRIGDDWQIKALFEPVKSDIMPKIAQNFTGLSVTTDD